MFDDGFGSPNGQKSVENLNEKSVKNQLRWRLMMVFGCPDGQKSVENLNGKSVKNQLRWRLMMVLGALTGRNRSKILMENRSKIICVGVW